MNVRLLQRLPYVVMSNRYLLFDQGKLKYHRPHYLMISDCTDFTLSGGLTLLDAPMFNVELTNATRAEISGLNITSTWCVPCVFCFFCGCSDLRHVVITGTKIQSPASLKSRTTLMALTLGVGPPTSICTTFTSVMVMIQWQSNHMLMGAAREIFL